MTKVRIWGKNAAIEMGNYTIFVDEPYLLVEREEDGKLRVEIRCYITIRSPLPHDIHIPIIVDVTDKIEEALKGEANQVHNQG